MINSFQIKNFRQIKSLKFESLGRVNLITGKNNTGKTSVLEALHIYASKGYWTWLPEILQFRDEDFNLGDRNQFVSMSKDSLASFFYNYKISIHDKDSILVGNKENDYVKLKFAEQYHRESTSQENDNNNFNKLPELSIQSSYKSYKIEDTIGNDAILPVFSYKHPDTITSHFANHRFRMHLAYLWDEITLTPKEEQVVEALRIIEPRVERLNFINGKGKKQKGIIRLDDGTRHSIGRMGDGINRILEIILALVNAENGFLLIDEFENGLHFSVQEKLWEVIFKTAEQLNVQVFATTHSNDCISAFAKVQQDLEYSDTKLFRMFLNDNGEVRHREFTSEDLAIVLEQNIEIRN